MPEIGTNMGCPESDCDGWLHFVEPGGCRAAFLYLFFLIGISLAVGFIANSLVHVNLWAWMVDGFVSGGWTGLLRVVMYIGPCAILSVLIVRKVFGLNPTKNGYFKCNKCHRRYIRGRESGTVIPI